MITWPSFRAGRAQGPQTMANMKFYFTPGACSIGIHILLEELELLFEAWMVNLVKGDNLKPEYLAINPQGTIPSLVLPDGAVLTDFVSIARWLAQAHPERGLLPEDPKQQQAVLDTLEFCVNHIHGQGFTRIFTTDRYSTDLTQHEAIVEEGRAIVVEGLAEIDERYAQGKLDLGAFTVADVALFYVEFWAERSAIELPPFCARHFEQMLGRPAVRQVLMEEGYHSLLN